MKVVVIIGGSDGIGKTTLVKLMAEGYKVYNLSRRNIENYPYNITLDVSNKDSIKTAIEEVIKKESRIDHLIYCAGYSMASTIEDVKEEDYKYLYDVILFGYIETLRTIVPHFKANEYGRVIFLSSLASKIPIPFDPYYCSAKAAVEAFNNTVNLEVNHDDIYLTNLVFGGVKTNFTFKRKLNSSDDNQDLYIAVNKLALIEQHGMDSLEIANIIYKLLNMNKPPLTYTIGLKNKVSYALGKVLKPSLINKFVKYKFKLKR